MKPVIVGLYAPKVRDYPCQPCCFWNARPEDQAGSCGPGRGLGDRLVPESLLGLRITPACAIHDWMYQHGKTLDDKEFSDRVFRQNMFRIVRAGGGPLRYARYSLAMAYYWAVKYGGEPAFWNSKHKGELVEVAV